MNKKTNKLLYFIPRILGIIFILFLMVFSLDVFNSSLTIWQTIFGLFIHNIPALFLLIILIIFWKYEIILAIFFLIASLFYKSSLIVSIPAFIIGILFAINWYKKRIKN